MRHSFRAVLALLLILGVSGPAAGGIQPRIFGTNTRAVLASIHLKVSRVGSSDTLRLRIGAGSDDPLRWGHWEVVLPEGMTYVSGVRLPSKSESASMFCTTEQHKIAAQTAKMRIRNERTEIADNDNKRQR